MAISFMIICAAVDNSDSIARKQSLFDADLYVRHCRPFYDHDGYTSD